MAKKRFGIGLVVGAVAGLLTGLLAAPKSGKETREDLKRRADEVKHETEKRAEQVKERAADVADKAKETAEHMRDVADHAVKGVQEGYSKTQDAKKVDADKNQLKTHQSHHTEKNKK